MVLSARLAAEPGKKRQPTRAPPLAPPPPLPLYRLSCTPLLLCLIAVVDAGHQGYNRQGIDAANRSDTALGFVDPAPPAAAPSICGGGCTCEGVVLDCTPSSAWNSVKTGPLLPQETPGTFDLSWVWHLRTRGFAPLAPGFTLRGLVRKRLNLSEVVVTGTRETDMAGMLGFGKGGAYDVAELGPVGHLDLSENEILSVIRLNAPVLKTLILNHNRITSLQNDTFADATALRFLSIHSCPLQVLEPGAFNGLRGLKRLVLNNGRLTELRTGTFTSLVSLKHLQLFGNTFGRVDASSFPLRDANHTALMQIRMESNGPDHTFCTAARNGVDVGDVARVVCSCGAGLLSVNPNGANTAGLEADACEAVTCPPISTHASLGLGMFQYECDRGAAAGDDAPIGTVCEARCKKGLASIFSDKRVLATCGRDGKWSLDRPSTADHMWCKAGAIYTPVVILDEPTPVPVASNCKSMAAKPADLAKSGNSDTNAWRQCFTVRFDPDWGASSVNVTAATLDQGGRRWLDGGYCAELFRRDSDGVHLPIVFTNDDGTRSGNELLHVFQRRFAEVEPDRAHRPLTLPSVTSAAAIISLGPEHKLEPHAAVPVNVQYAWHIEYFRDLEGNAPATGAPPRVFTLDSQDGAAPTKQNETDGCLFALATRASSQATSMAPSTTSTSVTAATSLGGCGDGEDCQAADGSNVVVRLRKAVEKGTLQGLDDLAACSGVFRFTAYGVDTISSGGTRCLQGGDSLANKACVLAANFTATIYPPMEAAGTSVAFRVGSETRSSKIMLKGGSVPIKYTIKAAGNNGDGRSRSALPAGLKFDSSTGVVSGTPNATTDGTHVSRVVATDSNGMEMQVTRINIDVRPKLAVAFVYPPPFRGTAATFSFEDYERDAFPVVTPSITLDNATDELVFRVDTNDVLQNLGAEGGAGTATDTKLGLPQGMAINERTGEVFGTFTEATFTEEVQRYAFFIRARELETNADVAVASGGGVAAAAAGEVWSIVIAACPYALTGKNSDGTGGKCQAPTGSASSSDDDAIAAGVAAGLVCVALVVVIFVMHVKYKRMKRAAEARELAAQQPFDFTGLLIDLAKRGVIDSHGNVVEVPTSTQGKRQQPSTSLQIPREIPSSCVKLFSEIGSGNWGVVHEALLTERHAPQMQVAVKSLKAKPGHTDRGEWYAARADLLEEACIMAQFDHPHILSLIGVCTENEECLVILPFCNNGSLKSVLKGFAATGLQEHTLQILTRLLTYCADIVEGCNYLAQHGFVHRDIAARNILVDESGECAIADFGLSRATQEDKDYYRSHKDNALPVRWTAPECFDNKYSEASDVWAFGVCVWEIFSLGATPYPGVTNFEVMTMVKNNKHALTKPKLMNQPLFTGFLLKCFTFDHKKRITFAGLLEILFDPSDAVGEAHELGIDTQTRDSIAYSDYQCFPKQRLASNAGSDGTHVPARQRRYNESWRVDQAPRQGPAAANDYGLVNRAPGPAAANDYGNVPDGDARRTSSSSLGHYTKRGVQQDGRVPAQASDSSLAYQMQSTLASSTAPSAGGGPMPAQDSGEDSDSSLAYQTKSTLAASAPSPGGGGGERHPSLDYQQQSAIGHQAQSAQPRQPTQAAVQDASSLEHERPSALQARGPARQTVRRSMTTQLTNRAMSSLEFPAASADGQQSQSQNGPLLRMDTADRYLRPGAIASPRSAPPAHPSSENVYVDGLFDEEVLPSDFVPTLLRRVSNLI